ncbi:MAG: type II secretion system F family protein [Anaerolineales bacterium]
MPYRYLAFDGDGNRLTGVLEVDSEAAAERALWDRGLTIVDIKEAARPFDWARLFPTFLGPKRRDIIIFSQQLANLVESGVGLVTALDLLAQEVSSRPLQRVVRQVAEDLRMGHPLSEALEKHETVFPPIYRRMMEVGERTGNLGFVLREMATYLEKEETVIRKMRSALAYPLFLLAMSVVVILIVFNFTLPPLLSLYDEFDADLPAITKAMMSVADFLVEYRLLLFIGAALLAVLITWYLSRPSGKRQFHQLQLRAPVIRGVVVQGAISRLSRSLGTLLRAGVSLPEAIQLSEQVVGNMVLHDAVEDLRQEALQGRGLSRPIARKRIFPRLFSQMVRVGEETGTLDSHLITLANFYEEEVDRTMDRLTGMLEPALIIVVGVVVGFVAISVILPMYSLLQNIR